MSRKMLLALAGVAALLGASPALKADAAALNGVSSLPPLVHSSSPVEAVRCVCGPRGCACGRAWRRGYWGWGRPGWGPGWGRGCWWRNGVRVCRW